MRVAIIPARGGSKRIKKKNIKNFCGFPIITHSIKTALDSKLFDHVIISTDDEEIASVSKLAGAEIPFIRPDYLSDDYAGTLPVIAHAIIEYESIIKKKIDEVCCIYATAPFVSIDTLNKSLEILLHSPDLNYVFPAVEYNYSIFRSFKMNNNDRCEMLWPENFKKRSQDFPKIYHDAGQFYWGKRDAFCSKKELFQSDSSPIILPHYLAQDIDTEEDWYRAELLYQLLKAKQ